MNYNNNNYPLRPTLCQRDTHAQAKESWIKIQTAVRDFVYCVALLEEISLVTHQVVRERSTKHPRSISPRKPSWNCFLLRLLPTGYFSWIDKIKCGTLLSVATPANLPCTARRRRRREQKWRIRFQRTATPQKIVFECSRECGQRESDFVGGWAPFCQVKSAVLEFKIITPRKGFLSSV